MKPRSWRLFARDMEYILMTPLCSRRTLPQQTPNLEAIPHAASRMACCIKRATAIKSGRPIALAFDLESRAQTCVSLFHPKSGHRCGLWHSRCISFSSVGWPYLIRIKTYQDPRTYLAILCRRLVLYPQDRRHRLLWSLIALPASNKCGVFRRSRPTFKPAFATSWHNPLSGHHLWLDRTLIRPGNKGTSIYTSGCSPNKA